jgi:two-component system chemotaxis response regulator CheY
MAKILIVDDSGLSRRLLRSILENKNHTVTEAEDGMSALEKYFIDKPDLVFLDLTMTGMHGLEVLKKMREMDPGAQIIVGSADIQSSTREMVREAGAREFVNKPFTAEAVQAAIEAVEKGEGR